MNFKQITAALLSAVIAAANTGVIAPAISTAAENIGAENVSLHNYDCTARISVINGLTGEYLEDHEIRLMSNPYGSSWCVAKWNTSEEVIKTVPDLYAEDTFAVDVQPLSKSETIFGEHTFTFDRFGQTKNIVLKVYPWKPTYDCNICVSVCDWTNFKDDAVFFTSNELNNEYISAGIYDENGNYFTSCNLQEKENYLYLPDGKYTLKASNSHNFHLVSANSEKAKYGKKLFDIDVPEKYEIDFEVKDGKSDKTIELFYEKYGEMRPANDITLRAVDSVTGENIEGIKLGIYSKDFRTVWNWDTSENPDKFAKTFMQGGYNIIANDVPPSYMQDFAFETEQSDSFSEIYYKPGEADIYYEADKPAEVTLKFRPINEQVGNCSANISFVDMSTGKNIEGAELTLSKNPTASSEIIETWNSSDEAVKHFNNLFRNAYYGIYVSKVAKDYCPIHGTFFNFNNNYEEQDIVIRAVPKNAKPNVGISINDYTDAKLGESGTFFEGEKIFQGNAYITVYDRNGNFFCTTSCTGYDKIYLPDGEYTATLGVIDSEYNIISRDWDLAKKIIECYPDMKIPYKEGIHFKVADGKSDRYLNFYVTKNKNDPGDPAVNGSLRLKVVDGRTFEPVEGAKVRIITNEYHSKLIADWVSSSDGELFVDGLEENWYYIRLDNVPEKYNYERSFSAYDNTFFITKENPNKESQIVLWPDDYKYYSPYLNVHDITEVEKDQNGDPIHRDPQYGGIMELSKYNDIANEYMEIKGADDGKVYYPKIRTTSSIVLPDGDYTATLLDVEGHYVTLGSYSEKAKILMETKGYNDGVYGFTTNFSVVDGKPVGKTDFYLYRSNAYDKMHMGNCRINVRAVDITDENNDPDLRIIAEFDPERQMAIVDNWNTQVEPKKSITGLFTMGDYRVTAYSESGDYVLIVPTKTVNFNEQTSTDIIFRAVPASRVKKGDSNDDGGVDMADVVMIMQSLANPNKYRLSELGAFNADMDGNGVTVGDAQKIQMILLGLEK
ncbi:MAG: dockerin type I repeat-containing protein [Ruminococcus sp.]|uniref:dockerin type I repeat-containing protein n=1 Tax=Ruminococcus sp. TaxID=41978 RepID=UPI0025D13012|nr:dockerin type I repeat-containing protein [Ruminococcus sp.]MCR5599850.1 dockerin type I repeat-containing protein [Ruminococcus sp.]